MNRQIACLATLAVALACKPNFPTCRNDSDCGDADNHGLRVHCFDGECQECKADADCGAGRSCSSLRCVAAVPTQAPPPVAEAAVSAPPPAPVSSADSCAFPTIHFDYNSSDLSPDTQQILQQVAACLQKRPTVHVRIEGDCDQRGTEEYNLALGQRRASIVEKYLEHLGVRRLGTISYGKDKLVCTEDTESCRRENRRAEFDVGR